MIYFSSRKRPRVKLGDRSILPFLTAVFFILTFAIKAFVDDAYARGEVSSTVAYAKYATAAIACFTGLACAFKKGERVFVGQFDRLMIIFGVFFLRSAVCMFATGITSSVVFEELLRLGMPMLLAYALLNSLDEKTTYSCMVVILIASFAAYLVNLGVEGVSLSDFMDANFEESDSATESSSFSGISLVLTLYFAFFRKRRLWLVMATVFCVFTFKRLAIVAAVAAFVVSLFFPKLMRVRVSKSTLTLLKVLTIAAVAFWAWILLPEQEGLATQLFGQDPRIFTMGRSMTYRFLLSTGFQSYGFGSANEVVTAAFGMPFEMDFIKIAFELTPLVMILFIWLFWDIAGTSLWGVVIIGFFVVNMITSDSLTSNFCLTLAYMTCGMVEQSFHERGKTLDKEIQDAD